MISFDFNNCRVFLEEMIKNNPENSELIKAYTKLIEEKTRFDIEWIKVDEEIRKDFEKNQTERFKEKVDVTKKSMDKNGYIAPYQVI